MTDFDAWLAAPPPDTPSNRMAAKFAHTKRPAISTTNPYSSIDCPYVDLPEAEWFRCHDEEGERLVQIREAIAFERRNLDGEWEREYRGYGVPYLKDGRRFAARGLAQFVRLIPGKSLPHHVKERLDAQPWPSRDPSSSS